MALLAQKRFRFCDYHPHPLFVRLGSPVLKDLVTNKSDPVFCEPQITGVAKDTGRTIMIHIFRASSQQQASEWSVRADFLQAHVLKKVMKLRTPLRNEVVAEPSGMVPLFSSFP